MTEACTAPERRSRPEPEEDDRTTDSSAPDAPRAPNHSRVNRKQQTAPAPWRHNKRHTPRSTREWKDNDNNGREGRHAREQHNNSHRSMHPSSTQHTHIRSQHQQFAAVAKGGGRANKNDEHTARTTEVTRLERGQTIPRRTRGNCPATPSGPEEREREAQLLRE